MWERITAIGTLVLIVLTIVLISQGAALTWLHWPWSMLPVGIVGGLIIAAVLNFLTASRRSGRAAPPIESAPHILIAADGMPLRISATEARVAFFVFSSSPIVLTFIGLRLGHLVIKEPYQERIEPFTRRFLTLSVRISMDDLKTFRSQSPIHILGTAKFGNLQQNFEFDAIADYGGQTLAIGTSGAESDTTKIDAMKIVKLSDQVDWNGGNTTYPLTLKMQLRNDSAKAVHLQLKEYRKKRVTLAAKGFPPQAFQLRFGNAWLPPGGTNDISVSPQQQFQAIIGLDETSFGKADVESHRGQIGTLVFSANGSEVSIEL